MRKAVLVDLPPQVARMYRLSRVRTPPGHCYDADNRRYVHQRDRRYVLFYSISIEAQLSPIRSDIARQLYIVRTYFYIGSVDADRCQVAKQQKAWIGATLL